MCFKWNGTACPVLKEGWAAGVHTPLHFQLVLIVLNIGTVMLKYESMYTDF
jgi:hypothetical protein